MKAEISRKFNYTYSVVRNEGSCSTFKERQIDSIEKAIIALENHRIPDNAVYQIIVEYAELKE